MISRAKPMTEPYKKDKERQSLGRVTLINEDQLCYSSTPENCQLARLC